MNLKITNIQISSYAESGQLPSLQFLADKLCEDDDMEYVLIQSKAHSSLDKIDVTNLSSIYTKLKEYPYEFEINSSLQLASINGKKLETNSNTCEHISNIITNFKPIVTLNNGTYLKVSNDAKTTDNTEISNYIYILNSQVYKCTNEKEIIIDNLDLEKKYSIQILAIDKNAKIKMSDIIEIETQKSTYLYNEGNEYIELTGGWQEKSVKNYGTSYGNYSKDSDHLYVKNTSTSNWGNSNYYPSWVTTNELDLSKYKKIIVEGDFYSPSSVITNMLGISTVQTPYDSGTNYNIISKNERVNKLELDIEKENVDKTKKYYLFLSAINSDGNSHSEITIRKIWLEN